MVLSILAATFCKSWIYFDIFHFSISLFIFLQQQHKHDFGPIRAQPVMPPFYSQTIRKGIKGSSIHPSKPLDELSEMVLKASTDGVEKRWESEAELCWSATCSRFWLDLRSSSIKVLSCITTNIQIFSLCIQTKKNILKNKFWSSGILNLLSESDSTLILKWR